MIVGTELGEKARSSITCAFRAQERSLDFTPCIRGRYFTHMWHNLVSIFNKFTLATESGMDGTC